MPRRKCFISYHHADETYVSKFINQFDRNDDKLIARRLGEMPEDLIKSTDTDYVMSCIRKNFIADASVTIVLMGKCTWARRYVDWEIQSSLRSGETVTPNGLLGIKLPTFTKFPERFNENLRGPEDSDCYARHMPWPNSSDELEAAIERAFERRYTHKHFIKNKRDRFTNNRECS